MSSQVQTRPFQQVIILILMLPVRMIANGQTCTVEYTENFSSDPHWVTDQPGNYFWDGATGTYHATTRNAQPGSPPTRYAYKLVDYDGNSMRLEFDVRPTDIQWSAGVGFGLRDANLQGWDSAQAEARWAYVFIGRADPGEEIGLYARGGNGLSQYRQSLNLLSDGT